MHLLIVLKIPRHFSRVRAGHEMRLRNRFSSVTLLGRTVDFEAALHAKALWIPGIFG